MLFNFCTLSVYCENDFRFVEKKNNGYELKASIKKAFLVGALNAKELKQDAYQISMYTNVCLHLSFIKYTHTESHGMGGTKPSTKQHQQQQQQSDSSKKSLFAKAVWRENSCRFFVDRTTLKCEESVCLFRNEQKGCLLDCLHLPKNIK